MSHIIVFVVSFLLSLAIVSQMVEEPNVLLIAIICGIIAALGAITAKD